jgi:cytochrome c-type biogenesis protein
LVFSAGILVTIAAIGAVTSLLGGLIGDIGTAGNYIVAAVFFAAGLYLLDVINIDFNSGGTKKVTTKGYSMAFVLGLLFGFGLGPCTFAFMAPVLGIVFHISSTNVPGAVLLLSAFAIGHCFVIAGAGTLSTKVGNYLKWSENSKSITIVKKICGILVILGGLYFIYITL